MRARVAQGSWHKNWVPFATIWDLAERLNSHRWDPWWVCHERHPQAGTGIPQAQNLNFRSPCSVSHRKRGFAATAKCWVSLFSWLPEQGPRHNSFIPPSHCSDPSPGEEHPFPLLGTAVQEWLKLWWHPLYQPGQGASLCSSPPASSSCLSNLSTARVTQIPAITALPRAELAHHTAVTAHNEHCYGDSMAFQRKLFQDKQRSGWSFPLATKQRPHWYW